MSYKQGDIVWIDYQYIGKNESKPRPCIVVSNSNSNTIDTDLIICPITTTIRLNSFSVLIENKDLSRSLPENMCEIKTNKIFTYNSSKILNKHGEIISRDKIREIIEKVISAIN